MKLLEFLNAVAPAVQSAGFELYEFGTETTPGPRYVTWQTLPGLTTHTLDNIVMESAFFQLNFSALPDDNHQQALSDLLDTLDELDTIERQDSPLRLDPADQTDLYRTFAVTYRVYP